MDIPLRGVAEEAIRRTVTPTGNGMHVTVPGDWHGAEVLILRLTPGTPRPTKNEKNGHLEATT